VIGAESGINGYSDNQGFNHLGTIGQSSRLRESGIAIKGVMRWTASVPLSNMKIGYKLERRWFAD
jgi:hypothetical protein